MVFIYIYLMIMTLLVTLAVIVAKQERKLKELRGELYTATKLFVNDRPQPKAPENDGKENLEQISVLMDEKGMPKGVVTSSGRTLLTTSIVFSAKVDQLPVLEITLLGGNKLNSGQSNIQFVKL